jgi:predicted ATPase
MIGHPGQALVSAGACVDMAETLNDPVNRAYAHIFAAGVRQFRREGDETFAHAELAVKIAEEHGFTFWLAAALCQLGGALALRGDEASGIASLSRGILLFRETGARLALPQGYSMLAEAHLWAKQYEAGLAAIAEGLEVVASTGEHAYEPELHRVRGELVFARDRSDVEASEKSLQKARDLARGISARSLELRALIALARLDPRATRLDPSRLELRTVYESFSEGLKTRDLRDARALLE